MLMYMNIAGHVRGFTLVELMTVVAIIGALAILSTFAWSGWRERTARTEVTNDLTGVVAGMESAATWNDDYPVFPTGTVFGDTATTRDVFLPSENVTVTYRGGNGSSYCIQAVSKAESHIIMHVRENGGNTIPADGAC